MLGGDYAPLGYLDNPFHSAVLNRSGIIRSVPSCGLGVLRQIEEYLQKGKPENLTVKCAREVAFYLLNEKRNAITKIELRTRARIFILPDDHLETPHFEVQRLRDDMRPHFVVARRFATPSGGGAQERNAHGAGGLGLRDGDHVYRSARKPGLTSRLGKLPRLLKKRQRPLRLALEELSFYSHEVRILGVYPAHPFRKTLK